MPTMRKNYLDYAKGIGIVLVVWGHSGIGLNKYISSFHMPLFFIISGLLYSDAKSWVSFFIRKVKSLYMPYFGWNALVLLLAILIGAISMRPDKIPVVILNIALTAAKVDRLLGATWFLATLFWVALAYRTIAGFVYDPRARPVFMGIVCLFGAYIAFGQTVSCVISKTVILGLFFAIGVLARQYGACLASLSSPMLAAGGFALAMWIASFSKSIIGRNVYSDPLLFIVAACLASYGVLRLCVSLERTKSQLLIPLKKLLSALGMHSADIMIWHFVCFKIVIALQLALAGKSCSLRDIMNYYPCYDSGHGWGYVYLLVGLFGSLAFGYVLRLCGTKKLSALLFDPLAERLDVSARLTH